MLINTIHFFVSVIETDGRSHGVFGKLSVGNLSTMGYFFPQDGEVRQKTSLKQTADFKFMQSKQIRPDFFFLFGKNWTISFVILDGISLEGFPSGNGNGIYIRIFYMYIFKCGLHLTTQPMNHEIAQRPDQHTGNSTPYSLR